MCLLVSRFVRPYQQLRGPTHERFGRGFLRLHSVLVRSGVEATCPGAFNLCTMLTASTQTVDFGDPSITYRYVGGGSGFNPAYINGFDFQVLNLGSAITDIDFSTDIAGLDQSRVSFTADSLQIHMQGLALHGLLDRLGSLKQEVEQTIQLGICFRGELDPESHLRSCFTRAATFACSFDSTTSEGMEIPVRSNLTSEASQRAAKSVCTRLNSTAVRTDASTKSVRVSPGNSTESRSARNSGSTRT